MYTAIYFSSRKKEYIKRNFKSERRAHEFAYEMDRKGVFVKVEELEEE